MVGEKEREKLLVILTDTIITTIHQVIYHRQYQYDTARQVARISLYIARALLRPHVTSLITTTYT
jgi:hypothetical protein